MGVPGPPVGSLLRGSANRREYWLFSAGLPPVGEAAGAVVVTYAQIRRLHDLGRTGWWVVLILAAQTAAAVGLFAAGLSESTILLVGTPLTVLAPILALGMLPGQPHEKRYGPAPGRRSLKEIFS
jgi:uncharacterized membrane protein YhaH (DUF805 family)